MLFEDLATELVTQVFLYCRSVNDVLALSSTCRRFHNISRSSQRLAILEHAAESQYGPLLDLTQLLTHNSSQPAHIIRYVPFSLALLKQIVHAGLIAHKWCAIYPFKKWKHDYESRRLLTPAEHFRLRRAIYRVWLYTRAFHTAAFPRETRVTRPVMQTRAALLHNWSTRELAELADFSAILRDVIARSVCPSNGTVARRHKKRHPSCDTPLLFNMALAAPPPAAPAPYNPFSNQTPANLWTRFAAPAPSNPPPEHRAAATRARARDPAAEGWGDDISHYYVVEDYMKLDPEQVLWLTQHAPLKGMVEGYVRLLGGWFENNGATLGQTLDWVLDERGESGDEFARAGV